MAPISLHDQRHRLLSTALNERYGGVQSSNFGTVTITGPDGEIYVVKDFHYPLTGGRVGMHFVPVNDSGAVLQPDGSWVAGSAQVDELLRAQGGLASTDPVYALVAYIRPEEHRLTWQELLSSKKLFYGYKHVGAYLGDGITTHAPEDYHPHSWRTLGHNVWHVTGYPATLFVVSLQGVDQSVLNRNARIVDGLLNKGIFAPKDFERMDCRVSRLNTALQFYRDWIRHAEYLSDLAWFMSCGDHKALVINVMLNLPHNPSAFRELFVDDGESLWSDFKQWFATVFGRPFDTDDETHFEPLWKKEGLTAEQVRPLSVTQHNEFDAALREKRLDSFQGARPLPPGAGMAWPVETPLDLISGFLSTYLPFEHVGGIASAAALVRMASQVSERLVITEPQYCALIAPLVTSLLIADAKQNALEPDDWLVTSKAKFQQMLSGAPVPFSGPSCTAFHASQLVNDCFSEVERLLPSILDEQTEERVAAARQWLRTEWRNAVSAQRNQAESSCLLARSFTTPGVLHRIAAGAYPCSRFVTILPVGTVVDHSELEGACDRSAAASSTHLGDPTGKQSTTRRLQNKARISYETHNQPAALQRSETFADDRSRGRGNSLKPAGCQAGQLVYALGQLGYDFGTDRCLEIFKQQMRNVSKIDTCPQNERHMLGFLQNTRATGQWHAEAFLWTLNIAGTPQYVIRPVGPFARQCHHRLLQSFSENVNGSTDRVAVPGMLSGYAVLLNGNAIPVIRPDVQGLCDCSTAQIKSVLKACSQSVQLHRDSSAIKSFQDRMYVEMQSPGLSSRDRSLNFALVGFLKCQSILEHLANGRAIDTIRVEKSKVCLPPAEYWNITLSLFDPDKPLPVIRYNYQCTVNVQSVIPLMVGELRSWMTNR